MNLSFQSSSTQGHTRVNRNVIRQNFAGSCPMGSACTATSACSEPSFVALMKSVVGSLSITTLQKCINQRMLGCGTANAGFSKVLSATQASNRTNHGPTDPTATTTTTTTNKQQRRGTNEQTNTSTTTTNKAEQQRRRSSVCAVLFLVNERMKERTNERTND